MRLASLVSAAALVAAASLPVIADAVLAPATQIPLPSMIVVGQGHGEFTTPGFQNGSVLAQLYDQYGTRQFTLKGDVVEAIAAGIQGGLDFGVFHGALLAPGVMLQVEGTWDLSSKGQGRFVAVVLGDVGEVGEVATIGKIIGTFVLPAPESRSADAQDALAQGSGSQASILHPLDGSYAPGAAQLNVGSTVPLTLRWMLEQ